MVSLVQEVDSVGNEDSSFVLQYTKVDIVDDLLATGGTVECVVNLLERNERKILGLLTVVELVKLKGRSKFKFPVESSILF